MTYQRRETFLPFTRPMVGPEEIEEFIDSVNSGWITTGPKAARFEEELAAYNGVKHCLAFSSATAAQEVILQLLELQRPPERLVLLLQPQELQQVLELQLLPELALRLLELQ